MTDGLAAAYDAERARLVRVAYAILGSHAEAEDVVADCWLRLVAADGREPVRDVAAWATVTVARAALDVLRSARVRRESYVGPWLPEPVVAGLEDRVSLDDSVRYALLVALERLSPAERTAWVLHDIFEMPFAEVAAAVGRTPEAVRQLARRARQHVAAGTPRVEVDPSTHDRVVGAFLGAAAGGDLSGLVRLLDPAVVLTSDGGGVVNAARRPVVGPDRVGRFMAGVTRKPGTAEIVVVNGRTGVAFYDADGLHSVLSFTVDGELITRIDIIRAPEKLRSVSR
ncbi:RNA polymerase sigma factor SigJ [Nocardioides mangrovi]|uniref:RNA polymerase sigma factor SigJ n=1 Tax=Nocardioides mangrovi TaxID=2874580 RepID=A0ABS7UDH9_9ACTN|nr:RNA polymerase sigma factor SigJ [Nocardioides mangrovi]MBZ5739058.1 RNA polymerase sigma factor SigJ [Nocardioides mangrovi]